MPLARDPCVVIILVAEHDHERGLALLAFSCGSGCVDEGVRNVGTRDVWTIVAKGFENDRDYVARAMAAMLILRNPSIVD